MSCDSDTGNDTLNSTEIQCDSSLFNSQSRNASLYQTGDEIFSSYHNSQSQRPTKNAHTTVHDFIDSYCDSLNTQNNTQDNEQNNKVHAEDDHNTSSSSNNSDNNGILRHSAINMPSFDSVPQSRRHLLRYCLWPISICLSLFFLQFNCTTAS